MEQIWARYYQQRPFPRLGNYMRKSILLALATHFQAADMKVVESWMAEPWVLYTTYGVRE